MIGPSPSAPFARCLVGQAGCSERPAALHTHRARSNSVKIVTVREDFPACVPQLRGTALLGNGFGNEMRRNDRDGMEPDAMTWTRSSS
jgi:hypothetical protein